MKKIFLLTVLFSLNTFGQFTDGATIPDFELNDLDGNQVNLYSMLDQGKVVLLDFFFPACRPCWDLTVIHSVNDISSKYGEKGSNQIKIYGINVWGEGAGTYSGNLAIPNINGVDASDQNFSRGDFEYFGNYKYLPQGSDYGTLVNIIECPTYLLVGPDRKAYNVDPEEMEYDAQNYFGVTLTKIANNLRIYVPEITTCSSSNTVTVFGQLRNTGSNNIVSARVKLMVNNTLISTQNLTFTGVNTTDESAGLPEFRFNNVLLDQPLGNYGKGPYKIVVDMINGVTLVNPIEKLIKIRKDNTAISASNLIVELQSDAFASDTSWIIYNANGDAVTQNQILQNNTTTNQNITLQSNGCYTLRLKDAYGDGIESGYLKLKTASNSLLFDLTMGNYNYENFGYDKFHSFSINALSVNENDTDQQTFLYPNPATDKFYLISTDQVTLQISDVSGKLLKSYKNVDKSNPIDISGLEDGVYFVSIINDSESKSIKLIKN
ncbi:T9SS type A sorting domain-containing protein [Flavobacterium sp. SUN046]|uniref:T9SS type A sorting domain-containing protein n=1 Tax=Flavobacterium sp. SUN046 TaxID=3002440 RepID=UPI002DBFE375|nr:T9SS type A sorting domain-containing protein [Flavobacterium sp. SUN046]MEC4050434.1 T9SS type A sorting domain-containing protein [Flavobacterium sp. SUN046]